MWFIIMVSFMSSTLFALIPYGIVCTGSIDIKKEYIYMVLFVICFIITFFLIIYLEYKYMCKEKLNLKWKKITYKELKNMFEEDIKKELPYIYIRNSINSNFKTIDFYDENRRRIISYGEKILSGNNVLYVLSYLDYLKYLFNLNRFTRIVKRNKENSNRLK